MKTTEKIDKYITEAKDPKDALANALDSEFNALIDAIEDIGMELEMATDEKILERGIFNNADRILDQMNILAEKLAKIIGVDY